jgi:hypothetical protein
MDGGKRVKAAFLNYCTTKRVTQLQPTPYIMRTVPKNRSTHDGSHASENRRENRSDPQSLPAQT